MTEDLKIRLETPLWNSANMTNCLIGVSITYIFNCA